jgi:putative hemolysin
VFEFDDMKVKEIMTPRIDVFAVEEHEHVSQILEKIKDEGYSRIPVYKGSIDKITGYIHIRDLIFNRAQNNKAKTLSKKILFVSGEKIIQELFALFQKTRNHIAVVVDEYGGIDGIVTLEDVLEELVGEIEDESDEIDKPIIRVNQYTYKIEGDTELSFINEKLHTTFPENKDFSTISGFIQNRIKDLPTEGQEILDKRRKIKIKITKMNNHIIEEVTLSKLRHL